MADAKRALVVDDDTATVAIFQRLLSADHWEVDATSSSREARGKIRPGHYQLVVSDLNMPELSGAELYEAAIKADPELKKRFLFVSGYADNPAANSFLLEAGCAVIKKPIRLEEFREVAAQIAGEKPIEATKLAAPWFTPESIHLYSGEITSRHTLIALMNRIHTARLTGAVHVLLGRVEKKIYFNLGCIVFAASNVFDDGLGELMLRAGALTQRQFDEASDLMRQGWKLGAALVDLECCTMAQLEDWVRQQLTRTAASILEYSSGRYFFFESFEENISPDVAITMPLGHFVLSAVRNAEGLPFDHLAHDEHLFVDISADPMIRFQDVALNEDERALLAVIEDPIRAAHALRASNLPPERAVRALYALLALGMVLSIPPVEEALKPVAPPASLPGTVAAPPSAGAAAPLPPAPAMPAASTAPSTPAPPPARAAPRAEELDLAEFEKEIKKRLEMAETATYYQILEITPAAEPGEMKKSFHRLARKFHPDRHMGRTEWIGSLQTIMDSLSLSYKTLTDAKSRGSYDKRLTETGAYTMGRTGGKTERQVTAEECLEKAKECLRAKNFAGSITWLRKCVEIAPDNSKHRAMLARSLGAVPQYRKEAIEHFEAAIKHDPWNVSAYFQFGELYESMQLPWRAKPLYLKILDIDPGHSKAQEKLKTIEAREKEGKGAPSHPPDEKDPGLLGKLFGKKP